MPSAPAPRRKERRGSSTPDTGERRRRTDDALDRLTSWMEAHDDWAREWTASMGARMESVERRADLLDGQGGNDGGLLQALGEVKGALEEMGKRQERQATALEQLRSDMRDVKNKTGAEDGEPKKDSTQKAIDFLLKVVLPVLLVVVPATAAIIVAYLQLKGQLAGLEPGSGR